MTFLNQEPVIITLKEDEKECKLYVHPEFLKKVEFFKKLLEGDFKEKNENKFVIQTENAYIDQHIIESLYTNKFDDLHNFDVHELVFIITRMGFFGISNNISDILTIIDELSLSFEEFEIIIEKYQNIPELHELISNKVKENIFCFKEHNILGILNDDIRKNVIKKLIKDPSSKAKLGIAYDKNGIYKVFMRKGSKYVTIGFKYNTLFQFCNQYKYLDLIESFPFEKINPNDLVRICQQCDNKTLVNKILDIISTNHLQKKVPRVPPKQKVIPAKVAPKAWSKKEEKETDEEHDDDDDDDDDDEVKKVPRSPLNKKRYLQKVAPRAWSKHKKVEEDEEEF